MLKQKNLTILKSMHSDYPNILSDERMFKSLARDLFENSIETKAVVRYICIALFEYDALSFLESDIERGESFAAFNLSKKAGLVLTDYFPDEPVVFKEFARSADAGIGRIGANRERHF